MLKESAIKAPQSFSLKSYKPKHFDISRQVWQMQNIDVCMNVALAFHPLGTNTPQSIPLFFDKHKLDVLSRIVIISLSDIRMSLFSMGDEEVLG